jgi:acyl-CoA synthetase (AMP-forming)/AMP-acid ligase II
VQPTRIFTSPSLLPLALTSGLPTERIYLLEGENKGHISYDQLVSSVRTNCIPRLPVRHATKDTLAYMVFSSGTSGLPKGMYLFLIFASASQKHGRIVNAVLITLLYSRHAITGKYHLCATRNDCVRYGNG